MKSPLLFVALSLSALLPASAHGQSEEPVLTGRAAIERIIGNTMVLAPTKPLPTIDVKSFIYFSPDGRSAMQMTASDPANEEETEAETEAGNWSIDDQERLCVVQQGKTLKDGDCIGVRVTGNTIHSVPEDVFDGATATLLEGNPRRL